MTLLCVTSVACSSEPANPVFIGHLHVNNGIRIALFDNYQFTAPNLAKLTRDVLGLQEAVPVAISFIRLNTAATKNIETQDLFKEYVRKGFYMLVATIPPYAHILYLHELYRPNN